MPGLPLADPIEVKRRLAAIFAADVEGYSRLMGTDEVATLDALTARREILDGRSFQRALSEPVSRSQSAAVMSPAISRSRRAAACPAVRP
jgi:class 3 adenylate cyclase